jgi:dTDP-4-dehydrorhamnose reductase
MKILITGASGLLGVYLLREACQSSDQVCGWSGSRHVEFFGIPINPVDLTTPDHVAKALEEVSPDVILHTAALARVADCQQDPQRAHRVNVKGSRIAVEQAARIGARLVLVSTDLVFDGEKAPYRESDEARPVSVYGRSKREAEQVVLGYSNVAVVRLGLLFGPSLNGQPSFFDQQISALRSGRPITLYADEWRTPLALCTAATSLLAIARSSFRGLLHLGGPERLSRLEMGLRLASILGVSTEFLIPGHRPHTGEPRPRDVSLDCSLWRQRFPAIDWPTWEVAVRGMQTSANRPL